MNTNQDDGANAPSMFSTPPVAGSSRLDPNFRESPTLDELAESQHVQPMADVSVLFGTWPGDETDEEIEAALEQLSLDTKPYPKEAICIAIRRLLSATIAPEITTHEEWGQAVDSGRAVIAAIEGIQSLNDWNSCPVCGNATTFSRDVPPCPYWCDKCTNMRDSRKGLGDEH